MPSGNDKPERLVDAFRLTKDDDDDMTDPHEDQPTSVRELSTDPFIQSIYGRYAALIEGTGTVTTDEFFAKNSDQVLADLSLLFGYIRGVERAVRR